MRRGRFAGIFAMCCYVGMTCGIYHMAFRRMQSGGSDPDSVIRTNGARGPIMPPDAVIKPEDRKSKDIVKAAADGRADNVHQTGPSDKDQGKRPKSDDAIANNHPAKSSDDDDGNDSGATVASEPSSSPKPSPDSDNDGINTSWSTFLEPVKWGLYHSDKKEDIPECPDVPGPGGRHWADNECTGGPSINATSAASPLVEDCRQMIANLKAQGPRKFIHNWYSCDQKALAWHKTCVFGIETYLGWFSCLRRKRMITTSGDIIDWVQDSIDKWADVVGDDSHDKKERVGAWGQSCCLNLPKDAGLPHVYAPVKWGIYHSGEAEDLAIPASSTDDEAEGLASGEGNDDIAISTCSEDPIKCENLCTHDKPPVNAISAASPLVEDCLSGIWHLVQRRDDIIEVTGGGGEQRTIYYLRSCALGIELLTEKQCGFLFDCKIKLSHGDMVDWIQDSIDRYADVVGDDGKERVGSWGDSYCNQWGRFPNRLPVRWGLYHAGRWWGLNQSGEREDEQDKTISGSTISASSPASLPAPSAREAFQDDDTTDPISTSSTDHYNYCEGGPSISALSAASPLVSDCRTLIDNLSAEVGNFSYKWISCKQHALASYKSCVFGIEHIPANKCFPWTTLETGNGDIIDWIEDSIDMWGGVVGDDKQERVGSWGISKCHNIGFRGDDYLPVKWGLYHSDGFEDSATHE